MRVARSFGLSSFLSVILDIVKKQYFYTRSRPCGCVMFNVASNISTPPAWQPPPLQGRSFIAANNCSPVGEPRAAVRGMYPGRADPAPTEPMLQVTFVPLRLRHLPYRGGVCYNKVATVSNGNSNKTGTVKFHSLNLVVFWKQCEACLTAS